MFFLPIRFRILNLLGKINIILFQIHHICPLFLNDVCSALYEGFINIAPAFKIFDKTNFYSINKISYSIPKMNKTFQDEQSPNKEKLGSNI